jgi:hypothetical protein
MVEYTNRIRVQSVTRSRIPPPKAEFPETLAAGAYNTPQSVKPSPNSGGFFVSSQQDTEQSQPNTRRDKPSKLLDF